MEQSLYCHDSFVAPFGFRRRNSQTSHSDRLSPTLDLYDPSTGSVHTLALYSLRVKHPHGIMPQSVPRVTISSRIPNHSPQSHPGHIPGHIPRSHLRSHPRSHPPVPSPVTSPVTCPITVPSSHACARCMLLQFCRPNLGHSSKFSCVCVAPRCHKHRAKQRLVIIPALLPCKQGLSLPGDS